MNGGTIQVSKSGRCGNSPRNAFVEDFAVDLLSGAAMDDVIQAGTDLPVAPGGITHVAIDHAISHGKVGAVNGRLRSAEGEVPFALFLEFTTTKNLLVSRVYLYLSR